MDKRLGIFLLVEKNVIVNDVFLIVLQKQDCFCDSNTLQMYDYILNKQTYIVFLFVSYQIRGENILLYRT